MYEVLTVEHIGLGWVTDLGRKASQLGLSRGGALDQRAARIANALVGNGPDCPLLEITAMDAQFRARRDVLLAVTGAPATIAVDQRSASAEQPFVLRDGETLSIAGIHGGMRVYVALLGGFDAPMVLGSCAPDAFVDVGGPLRAGETLYAASDSQLGTLPRGQILTRLGVEDVLQPDPTVVEVTIGPHAGLFSDLQVVFRSEYEVSPRSNHVGLRLAGPVPKGSGRSEMLSSGVPIGAIEVTGGDELLALHRGRGVTAGYPVVAVATAFGLDTLAQAAPGSRLSIRESDPSDVIARIRIQRSQIADLSRRARNVLDAFGVSSGAPARSTSDL